MPGRYRENPRIEEGDVSSLVAFALGTASVAVALLLSPGAAIAMGVVAMMLGGWHAARGERPVLSALTVPLGLAAVVAAAVRLA